MKSAIPPTNLLSRLRHKRGFGIHSPYAYRVVKHVIAPAKGYGYYAEKGNRTLLADADSITTSLCEMLYRWCASQGCNKLVLGKSIHDKVACVLGGVCKTISVLSKKSDILSADVAFLRFEDLTKDEWPKILKNSDKTVIIGIGIPIDDAWEDTRKRTTGIFFYSRDAIMLIPYNGTAFTYYDMDWHN